MRRLLLPLLLLVTTVSAADRSGFSYIYKRGDQAHLRTNGASIDSLVRISRRWSGELVWLRRHGRSYLIRDAAVLLSVRGAFAEMHALEPRLRAAEERRRPVEVKMEAIEERMDRLSDQLDDDRLGDATRESLEARLREAERAMSAIEGEHRAVERAAEEIEEEMERLEKTAEQKFEQIVVRAIEQGKAKRVD